MKTLALLRHAKTERDSTTGRDFDRQLAERGERDAARIGEELREQGLQFDLLLSSPAARAVQTAELAGLAPRFDERIYDASVGKLLTIVQETNAESNGLLMIGHNPGFEQLASLLVGAPIGMPTGSLAVIELPIDDWRDAGGDCGRLARVIRPKELD